ncbi:MAG: phosphoserine phosphatase SerB [Pseudomonadota bacterium]
MPMVPHVVMIGAPERGTLQPALVDSVRNAWSGADVAWLAPDEAAAFAVPIAPSNAAEVGETCRSMNVDLVLLPGPPRRRQLLIADMDSTMIGEECIDELADEAGVGARVADITARAMNGEMNFEEALLERVGLLKDLPVSVISHVLANRIHAASGAEVLLRTLTSLGTYTALVSGGFTAFTGSVATRLGFDEHRANVLLKAEGRLTGDVARPILGKEAKVTTLHEVADRLGISSEDVVAVGDGANDLGMLDQAGLGVALHAKPAVATAAPIRIDHGDLTALLYLQGIARKEFVT